MYVNISGLWKSVKKIYINKDGLWKSVLKGYVNISGLWKLFFSGEEAPSIQQEVTISQETDSGTAFVTLTGTNYHWTNFTSLNYYFEWSQDGGSTWFIINSGSILNPSLGSSNTKTYLVQISNTAPNIDNLYRFRVFAQNNNISNSSTSNSTIISTPRNVTNVSAARIGSTLQANVSFSTGLYTNSVKITRKEYIESTLISTSTFDRTTASPASITLPSYNRTYTFTVTPYSGNLQAFGGTGYVTGYPGNETSETPGIVIGPPPTPSQLTKPTLSSTGSVQIGTTLTATAGTYQSGTYNSITTRVYGWSYPPPTISDGSTTAPLNNVSSGSSTSLTTSQSNINYTFYAVDIVTSSDLLSTYYYYSNLSANAFLPSFSDNFNRANTSGSDGIGRTSTGSWFWSLSGNLYGYQNPTTDTDNLSWEIDNNNAYNGATVFFGTSPTGHPMKTINVGDSNVSLAVSIPNGGGGPGLAFWVTASGSWWAVAPSYYSQSVTSTTCSGGPTYPSSTDGCCAYNGPYSSTSYDCGGGPFSGAACPPGPFSATAANLGERCSACSTDTQTLCLPGGNCIGEFCCPQTGTGQGDRCGPCTLVKTCTGGPENYANNTLGTGCGDKCQCTGPFTSSGTSTCTSSTTQVFSNPGPAISCVTAADAGKPCEVTFIGNSWLVKYCVLGTPASTYYECYTNVCANTYDINNISTVYSWNVVRGVESTYYECYSNVTSSVTTYYSRLRILSANGSSVVSEKEQIMASSTAMYQPIRSIDLTTSGNSITANAYSDTARVIKLGDTLTYTAINPTKTVSGDSAVGIINTPTDANRQIGNRLDDFIYNNI